MKKQLIVFILSVISYQAVCMNHYMPKRAFGLTILPDYGFGLSYTHYAGHVAAYASYDHNLKIYSGNRFDKSQKISAGIAYLFFDNTTKYPGYLSLGASYNTYADVIPFYAANKKAMQPYDLQLGTGAIINHIAVGFRYDIIKNDAMIDLKVNFGRKIIKQKYTRK